MRLLLLIATAAWAQPVETAWIRSAPSTNAELRKRLPEVQEVLVDERFVEVHSAGISLYYLGPFQTPLNPADGLRALRFRIPRTPVVQEGGVRVGPGELGVFLNGVPVYNRFAGVSYQGRNMWHFDLMSVKNEPLGVLEPMIANGSVHSPILGFALDGFPIYGPWAFANSDGSGGLRRMRSGYRLRAIRERTTWPDGTLLTPSQYGPPVDAHFPVGTFAEDYEFSPQSGDLDSSNGRFCVTPEYPHGTYAYFLSTNESSEPEFPYLLYDRFRGSIPHDTPTTGYVAGTPVTFDFTLPGPLEIVHEKPVHLIVVSEDLEEFAHIHPMQGTGGLYSVTHTFSQPGKHRLFMQFTRPGGQEELKTLDVVVTGTSLARANSKPPISASLDRPDVIRTGADVKFTVKLTGASIEPYLGAWGHFIFLDDHRENFIHAHPEGTAAKAQDPRLPHTHGITDAAVGRPPTSVTFTTNFQKPGRYKLWAQFQVSGEAVAIPFSLDVLGWDKAEPHPMQPIPEGAIQVTVDGQGFHPARIELPNKNPVTLAVTRAITPNCASRILFPSLGIERDLPLGETVLINLPERTGDTAFSCGMGMLRGVVASQ